jgi:hypothetical protein
MKRLLFLFIPLLAAGLRAEQLPPARDVLSFARMQLPAQPVRLTGTLKERAPNGFVKKKLAVEMDLEWGASPSTAAYRIRDEKTGDLQTLKIRWLANGPDFRYSENGTAVVNFNPNTEIDGLGVTWADLSFSFLWSKEAETVETDKKLGRASLVLAIPRAAEHRLLLWIEQETGRMLGAREEDENGNVVKEIKVVSVKEFDGLWMVKDLDIILPPTKRRITLRIENVETAPDESVENGAGERIQWESP